MHRPIAILALTLLPVQADHAAVPTDLTAYARALDRAANDLSAAGTAQEARAIAAALPDRWSVAVGGHLIVVEAGWIDTEVSRGAIEPHRWAAVQRHVVQRLRAMQMEAAAPGVVLPSSPDDTLHGVLARREFQRNAGSRWLEEALQRVIEWIRNLLGRFSGSPVSARSAAMVLAWTISVLALVALTVWLVGMLTRSSLAASLELGSAAIKRPPAREWALRALAAARSGDMREAVRCAYHAALSRLEEQGIWQVDESRTPREYLRLLRTDDPRRTIVTDLTRQFEQVWYGGRAASAEATAQLTAHLEHLGCLRGHERAI